MKTHSSSIKRQLQQQTVNVYQPVSPLRLKTVHVQTSAKWAPAAVRVNMSNFGLVCSYSYRFIYDRK